MKKITTLLVAGLAAMASSVNVSAQAEFDFSSATNYCPIYLGEQTLAPIQNQIKLDLRTSQIDIWSAGETMVFIDAIGPNSNGVQGEFLALEVAPGMTWSGGAFNTGEKDLSEIDDSYFFHIALLSEDSESFTFTVTGSKNGEAALVFGQTPNSDGVQAFDDFDRDGEWHAFDISVKELKKLGWKAGVIEYAPFSFSLGSRAGTRCSFVAIFYYQKADPSNIGQINAEDLQVLVGESTLSVLGSQNGIDLYDISGKQVKSTKESVVGINDLNKGVYVLKSGSIVKKVAIK